MQLIYLFFQTQQTTQTVTKTVISYNSTITWTVAVLVLVWIVWNLILRYKNKNAKRRTPKQSRNFQLKKIVRIKNELTAIWLRKGASKKIHAIGIGKLESGEFCIQIFINNSDEKFFEDGQNNSMPDSYKGIPLILIAMPQASFLSEQIDLAEFTRDDYKKLRRDKQDVIMGGISGANTNLNGEYGTIGYFCRKKSLFRRKSDVYMLSNSHVFADLRKPIVDEHDLIMQPSPGESAISRPIGELKQFAHPQLENDTNTANFVDAAIAKLWTNNEIHKPLVPMIGTVKGFVEKADVEIGEMCRKFGRTTGFTQGDVFSIYLDIWVKFDRTGQTSFFKDQILIEPNREICEKFVDKGDSGSLVIDSENNANGLIFAGANGDVELNETADENSQKITKTVNNFGVANPISEVMRKLNIELL